MLLADILRRISHIRQRAHAVGSQEVSPHVACLTSACCGRMVKISRDRTPTR